MITVKANDNDLKKYEGVYHNKFEVYYLIEEDNLGWGGDLEGNIEVLDVIREDGKIVEMVTKTLYVSGDEEFDW